MFINRRAGRAHSIVPNLSWPKLLLGLAALLVGLAPATRAADEPNSVPARSDDAKPALAATGPTLKLDYGKGRPEGNPVADFMYFVALIAPEPVAITQSAGNTQRARVLSLNRRVAGNAFLVICEYEFTGQGSQRNAIDHRDKIRLHERELKAGRTMDEQLESINIQGGGILSIEAEGTMADRVPIVNEVRLRFNGRGRESPVTIGIHDIKYAEGAYVYQNEIVARVNSLTFTRKPGVPRMEISLASVKRKEAGNSMWQNFVGGVKGAAANMFIKPIVVQRVGNEAMLNFGRALVLEAPQFTFPLAKNLKTSL